MAHSFGPTALATPANAVTIGRLVAAPLLLVIVLATGPSTWFLVALWVILAGTDGLDGWIARRQGTTRSGAFLDPLADKFLVLSALAGLASLGAVGWLPVSLIALREIAMSVFRSYAARRGVTIPARQTAKLKTMAQDAAVLLAFMPVVGGQHSPAVGWVLWFAVALTLWTGLEYLHDGRRLLAGAVRAPTAPPA